MTGMYLMCLRCNHPICLINYFLLLLSRYSDTFTYAGDYEDKAEANEQGIRQNRIVAIDALEFHHCPASVRTDPCCEMPKLTRDYVFVFYQEEYKVANIDRELNKAYCGFYNDGKEGSTPSPVATGEIPS